jgi:SAM-dependent methyltransferase
MPEGWQWDSSLFRGSAAFYGRGRLPYAPGFAGTLAGFLGWDGRGRLLDVGCGPGTVLLGLAHYFTEAVGVDPDGDMLAEARRQAGLRGVTNARWVTARAEELPAGLGGFRAVAFGNSFHWTDRTRVAASVLAMLEPGGAFVHLSDLKDPSGESVPPGRPPEPSPPAPPYTDIAALKLRHLGPLRRAGRGTSRRTHPVARTSCWPPPASMTSPGWSSRPDRWSSAAPTTSWRGCSPCRPPRRTSSGTGCRSSSGTFGRC